MYIIYLALLKNATYLGDNFPNRCSLKIFYAE